jgi:hypothetical protein
MRPEAAGHFFLERRLFQFLLRACASTRGNTAVAALGSRIYLDRGWETANAAGEGHVGTIR